MDFCESATVPIANERRNRFLVASADDAQCGAIVRKLRPFGDTIVAPTCERGHALIRSVRTLDMLVSDSDLSDGLGFDLLAVARELFPRTRMLVLFTANSPTADVNRAASTGAFCAFKPIGDEFIEHFMGAARAAVGIGELVEAWTTECGLSAAETNILRMRAEGYGREAIASSRHSTALTLKKQIATLLKKTGDDSLQTAVERLLREALFSDATANRARRVGSRPLSGRRRTG